MTQKRRAFIVSASSFAAASGLIFLNPRSGLACLVGTWKVRCPKGHIDTVDAVTCNHKCDTCGAIAMSDGEGDVVCPDGHVNHVVTGGRGDRDKWLTRYACTTCKKECRTDLR